MNYTLERPFYFIVVVWGARYCDYFLEYLLPSMLAPGNLPSLSTRQQSKFLIATTAADWAVMETTPIFSVLRNYVVPTFIEIPPSPPDGSSYDLMGVGHHIACEMAHRDAAYTMVLAPDCMLSDNSIVNLQRLAKSGQELVTAPVIRFGEEPLFLQLRKLGALSDTKRSQTGSPLTISGRQMAFAAVNGMHNETEAYEWDAPGLLLVLPVAWWRVPGENGILLHSLHWWPLMLDFGAIGDHDTTSLDQWTMDGDYLFNNTKNIKHIHAVQDTDEIFLVNWGPMNIPPIAKRQIPLIGKLAAKAQFGASYKSAFFDEFKRRLFFLPLRWHGHPLNDKWEGVERRAMRELLRYTTPPGQSIFLGADSLGERLRRLGSRSLVALFVGLRPIFVIIFHRQAVRRKLQQLVRADKASLRQLLWYVRLFGFNRS